MSYGDRVGFRHTDDGVLVRVTDADGNRAEVELPLVMAEQLSEKLVEILETHPRRSDEQ